jgi:hypothetical protein
MAGAGLLLVALVAATTTGTPAMTRSSSSREANKPPPPPPPLPVFQFSPTFGDDMVLQMQPAAAAVYGFTGEGGSAVSVSVKSGDKILYTVPATLNSTQQPFGGAWGERPNAAGGCFNPWCEPLSTWKALLKPAPPGGNYTITASCTGCTGETTATLTSATFGDVWHCSGQSNMWLPVQKTYSRNDTVAAIKAGKYTNIHLMAGNSGTAPQGATMGKHADKGGLAWPAPYGAKGGSNPWMTSAQAIADGTSSGLTGGNMSLFKMGATCWYFAQQLAELGVDHPIGIVNTAIGGQRIEEYMVNTSIATCANRSAPGPFDATLFGQQILPFVDMTVKGWICKLLIATPCHLCTNILRCAGYQGYEQSCMHSRHTQQECFCFAHNCDRIPHRSTHCSSACMCLRRENNMGGRKGNSVDGEGYSCSQRVLIEGWRKVWSKTPGTTDAQAPFGIVTLASSGSEGGPNVSVASTMPAKPSTLLIRLRTSASLRLSRPVKF